MTTASLRQFSRTILAPLAPVLAAAMLVVWHEHAGDDNLPSHRDTGHAAARATPIAPGPGAPRTGHRMRLASGSIARLRVGATGNARHLQTSDVRGSVGFDMDGLPARLDVEIDLAGLVRDHGAASGEPSLAWDVLGTKRTTRLGFRAVRHSATLSAVPGVTDVSFAGGLRLGGMTRHIVLLLRFVSVRPGHARLVGRGAVRASDFGLPGPRGSWPFANETPMVIVWDLALEPLIE